MHFASQLGVYAILAACSGSFNIALPANTDTAEVFKGDATALTGEAIDENQKYHITKSFRGINIMLFTSRMLLFAQYVRVMWYRKRAKQFWSWRFLLTPLSLLFAGSIFLGCFIMIKEAPDSKTVAIAQLILWGLAVLSQVIAGAFTPNDGERVLKSEGAMAPRLSSLTVIILGEGLNAICATLRNGINSLGLTKTMVGQSLTMLLILYFIWLLYFDGFRIKYSPSKILEELWLYLHFLLHLSLIMLLEGVKNVFVCATMLESYNRLRQAFVELMIEYDSTGMFPEHSSLEKLMLVLNFSWKQELNDLMDALSKDAADPTGIPTNVPRTVWRWWGDMVHSLILLYNDGQTDPEGEYKFQTFTQSDDIAIVEDFYNSEGPLLSDFFNSYLNRMSYTGYWIVAVGGTLILCMAIINTVQRRPRNRFAWGYSLSRCIIGGTLIVLGGATSKWIESSSWIIWILPIIATGYGVGVVVDRLILSFSVRSIRARKPLSPSTIAYSSVEKGDYDPGTGVDLVHLSHLPYDHGRPHREEPAPAGIYAQGPIGSSTSFDAAEEDSEKLHEESRYSLPYKP